MSLPYLDAEQIAEALEFLRNGGDEERAAGHYGVTVPELNQLLGRPQWKPTPAATGGAEFDLFACDRLDGQL